MPNRLIQLLHETIIDTSPPDQNGLISYRNEMRTTHSLNFQNLNINI